MTKLYSKLLLVLLFVIPQSYAADTNNLFMVKGAGLASCERFLEARKTKSNEYMSYGGWIDGYLSALNQLSKETYDLAPWQSTDYLANIAENFCNSNPQSTFFEAFAATAQALHKDRLSTQSDLVNVKVGGKGLLIRKEIIIRMQAHLARKYNYSGNQTGNYDVTLTEAVKDFQKKHTLKVSGLPDQQTLIKMFYADK